MTRSEALHALRCAARDFAEDDRSAHDSGQWKSNAAFWQKAIGIARVTAYENWLKACRDFRAVQAGQES